MNDYETDMLLVEHYVNVINKVGRNNLMFIALYGSQNYGLQTENSDVDTKALILPTLNELIHYEKISTTIQGDKKGGLCDLKHVQLMFENFIKQNINFLEIMYTNHVIVNNEYQDEYKELVQYRDTIAGYNINRLMHAVGGMALQKINAMEKVFEGKKEILDFYGYDPKQLASLLRLQYFAENYYKEHDFSSAIYPDGAIKDFILSVKAGEINLDCARKVAFKSLESIDKIIGYVDNSNDINEVKQKEAEVKEFLNNLSLKLIKKSLKQEI